MKSIPALSILVVAASAVSISAAELESGLQIGDRPAAFYVTDVTGPSAGEKLCYRCQYSTRPVVSIFARGIDDSVKKLLKEIDGLVQNHRDEKMAAFVVLLSDEPTSNEAQLKATAKQSAILNTPLTTYEDSNGPRRYRIHKDAEVTVIMWVDSDVRVNHAFAKGKLSAGAIKQVVADTSKILD